MCVCVNSLPFIWHTWSIKYAFSLDGTLFIVKYVLHLCAQYVQRIYAAWCTLLLWGAVE